MYIEDEMPAKELKPVEFFLPLPLYKEIEVQAPSSS